MERCDKSLFDGRIKVALKDNISYEDKSVIRNNR